MRRFPSSGIAWEPLGALALYAVLTWAFLYRPGLLRLDDFGYLHSTIETFLRHRPYTHDYLDPYSATMSVLGSLAYAATGNFPWATWGLLYLFACLNFLLLYRLIRGGLSSRGAAVLALAGATLPAYWYKTSEYTSNVFTLTLVLAALLAYRSRRWPWFFLAAALAYANRQNSLALMALPAYHLFHPGSGRPERLKTAAVLASMAGVCLVLHFGMNQTVAQSLHVFVRPGLSRIGIAFFTGACLGLAMFSALRLLTGESPWARARENLRRPWLPGLLSLGFVAILAAKALGGDMRYAYLEFCTPLFFDADRASLLQVVLAAAVPVLLFCLDWRRAPPLAPAFLAAAYLGLSCMRGFWYDFYLPDLALALLFLRLREAQLARPLPVRVGWLSALILTQVGWAYGFSIVAGKEDFYIGVYERMERRGALTVDRMTSAPFGYLGWKLWDYARERAPAGTEIRFSCYLLANQVVVETGLPWRQGFRRQHLPEGARILEAGETRIGGFPVPYRVVDLGFPAGRGADPYCFLPFDPAEYRPRPLPRDPAEWDAYLRAKAQERLP